MDQAGIVLRNVPEIPHILDQFARRCFYLLPPVDECGFPGRFGCSVMSTGLYAKASSCSRRSGAFRPKMRRLSQAG